MVYRLVVAACIGVVGCAGAPDQAVIGKTEALAIPRCKGEVVARIGSLIVHSSEGDQIAVRPSALHLVLADGVQMWPAADVVTDALAQEARKRTADEIMAWPPALIAAAADDVADDPRFALCRYEWSTVTDLETDEVFTAPVVF